GLEELGGFRRRREVVGDLTVGSASEQKQSETEFASDLERDLDELCKNEKHRTQLKEETLMVENQEEAKVVKVSAIQVQNKSRGTAWKFWLLTTSKKGKAEIIQRDSTGSKPEKLHRASKHRMCVPLPSGGILTPNGLQSLGLSGLGSNTGFERLHYRLERVWEPILVPRSPKRISHFFLNVFETWHSFDTNPLLAFFLKNL
ncbi:hypothetical protein HID58_060697, partial [Brassica napus]